MRLTVDSASATWTAATGATGDGAHTLGPFTAGAAYRYDRGGKGQVVFLTPDATQVERDGEAWTLTSTCNGELGITVRLAPAGERGVEITLRLVNLTDRPMQER